MVKSYRPRSGVFCVVVVVWVGWFVLQNYSKFEKAFHELETFFLILLLCPPFRYGGQVFFFSLQSVELSEGLCSLPHYHKNDKPKVYIAWVKLHYKQRN